MSSRKQKTIVIGPEYDQDIRRALKTVVAHLKVTSVNQNWAIGGSQELAVLEVLIDGEPLVMESETYLGLTITGGDELVDRVASLIAAEMLRAQS